MKIIDRYTGKPVKEKDLPPIIDFGRFGIKTEGASCYKEMTYSNFPTQNIIKQDILSDENQNLQEIFLQIGIKTDNALDGEFNIVPLIERIKSKLNLNEFERLLHDKLKHIEQIFHNPHTHLNRYTEKVPVSRSKRISLKSYEYLASHTEDWLHKSIVSFRPSRVLNEILEDNLDIYENRLSVAFVNKALRYLNARLAEVEDIHVFFKKYKELLENKEYKWHKKTNRILSLIGKNYEDDSFQKDDQNSLSTLTKTGLQLKEMQKRLKRLKKLELFSVVNQRKSQTITLRNTNVIVNHQHYRNLKRLWIELRLLKPDEKEQDKTIKEQEIFNGFKKYAIATITYALQEYLDYELIGNYKEFSAEHLFFPDLSFKISEYGILELTLKDKPIRFILIANTPNLNDNEIKQLKADNAYIIYYSNDKEVSSSPKTLNINPYDAESVERVAIILKKHLLLEYISNIQRSYKFPQMLRGYTKYIEQDWLRMDSKSYHYEFTGIPQQLSIEDIKDKIEKDAIYDKIKSRPRKNKIINEVKKVINDINDNSTTLKENYLFCFQCSLPLQEYENRQFNYLKCSSCQTSIEQKNNQTILLKNIDKKYDDLSPESWGMDYLDVNKSDYEHQ